MLYNGQINGRNTQLSTTRRLIKHHETPSTTIVFAATLSSTSSMSSTSSHQDTILVAGDGNGDVEAQQGLLPRSTDQGTSHGVKETRHNYEYPTHQKLEQSRGGHSYVDNHDRDATLIIVTKNYDEQKKSCNNNSETSGPNTNAKGDANNQQESSRDSRNGSISEGNTETANDAGQCRRCHVCCFTWSTWDKVLLLTFMFSTCAAAVALILFQVVFT
jgi:hypothetical protein